MIKSYKQFLLDSKNVLDNGYRYGSTSFFESIHQSKKRTNLSEWDIETLSTDIGLFGLYNGEEVPLDLPLMNVVNEVELDVPHYGGNKKYYVYTKDEHGRVIKVEFGDPDLSVKFNDKQRRDLFVARHKCAEKKDRTKPGYWSCNLPKYAKQLGLVGGGNFFW